MYGEYRKELLACLVKMLHETGSVWSTNWSPPYIITERVRALS